jgi:mono/diheme cytochrome c family protein
MRHSRWTYVWAFAVTGCSVAERDEQSFGSATIGPGGEIDGGGTESTGGRLDGDDDRPVVHSDEVPPPISGGTLLLIDDGDVAVAADPDRDLVFITRLADLAAFVAVELEPGDEPGRVIVDAAGLVHVALRGGAAIATIDPVDATVVARNETCANPRGLAFDAPNDQVLVACAGGELVTHEVGGPVIDRIAVAPDLRDVFVDEDGSIRVSRFRTAELLTLDDGVVVQTERPILFDRVATTAWRTRAMPYGGWLMIHQSSTTMPVDLDPPVEESAYGGPDGSGCEGPVASILSVATASGDITSTMPIAFANLPVDVAVSADGQRIAVAVAGQSDVESPSIGAIVGGWMFSSTLPPDPESPCAPAELAPLYGQVVAVEWLGDTLVAQTREPAGLQMYSLAYGSYAGVDFGASSRYDTGHELFHQDAGAGLSCASCHPEGGDDGFVWAFAPSDRLRRTQSLRVGLAGTEPFHWDGDMDDFAMIANEVHGRRMGAAQQSAQRVAAFRDWVFAIAPSNPERRDDALAARGSEVFTEAGCASCHNADALTNGMHTELGGESLQVPALDGLALRPPYMHDGRAPDLAAAVTDMLATTQPSIELPPADIDALVAYLGTL